MLDCLTGKLFTWKVERQEMSNEFVSTDAVFHLWQHLLLARNRKSQPLFLRYCNKVIIIVKESASKSKSTKRQCNPVVGNCASFPFVVDAAETNRVCDEMIQRISKTSRA